MEFLEEHTKDYPEDQRAACRRQRKLRGSGWLFCVGRPWKIAPPLDLRGLNVGPEDNGGVTWGVGAEKATVLRKVGLTRSQKSKGCLERFPEVT